MDLALKVVSKEDLIVLFYLAKTNPVFNSGTMSTKSRGLTRSLVLNSAITVARIIFLCEFS